MLLQGGLTFAVGYHFIALAGVALFTEANISLPDVLLQRDKPHATSLACGFSPSCSR